MSTIVLSLVWPLDLPPSEKAVLVSLADNSNDQGFCWPAIEPREGNERRGTSITERTCLSARTVQTALASLQARGLVEREFRKGRSTIYQLNLERMAQRDLLAPTTPATAAPPQSSHPREVRTPAAVAPVQLDVLPPAAAAPTPASVAGASAAAAPQPSRTSMNHQGTVIAARERDLVFEAVTKACSLNADELTPNERDRVNGACKQLRGVKATPDEIARRAELYPQIFTTPLTPMALVSNWAQLGAAGRSSGAMPRSNADWQAWGAKQGIDPRPGEPTETYVARLRDAYRSAA